MIDPPRFQITHQDFVAMFPDAHPDMHALINHAIHDGNINTPGRVAAFLALISYETQGLAYMERIVPTAPKLRARCQRLTGINLDGPITRPGLWVIAVFIWNHYSLSLQADRGDFYTISVRYTQRVSPPDRAVRYQYWTAIKAVLMVQGSYNVPV